MKSTAKEKPWFKLPTTGELNKGLPPEIFGAHYKPNQRKRRKQARQTGRC